MPETSGLPEILPDVLVYSLPNDFQNLIELSRVLKKIPGNRFGCPLSTIYCQRGGVGIKNRGKKITLPQYMGYNLVLIRGLRFLLQATEVQVFLIFGESNSVMVDH